MNPRNLYAVAGQLIVAAALFTACATKAKAPTAETNAIIGKWQWIESVGGIAGSTESAAETKTTKVLTFDQDGTVSLVVNDKPQFKDSYTLLHVKSIFTGADAEAVKYTTDSKIQSYRFNKDTLFLSEECHDCYRHVYVRKR